MSFDKFSYVMQAATRTQYTCNYVRPRRSLEDFADDPNIAIPRKKKFDIPVFDESLTKVEEKPMIKEEKPIEVVAQIIPKPVKVSLVNKQTETLNTEKYEIPVPKEEELFVSKPYERIEESSVSMLIENSFYIAEELSRLEQPIQTNPDPEIPVEIEISAESPLFLPVGYTYPNDITPQSPRRNIVMTGRKFYDANYQGFLDEGESDRDSMALATLRNYCYTKNIRLKHQLNYFDPVVFKKPVYKYVPSKLSEYYASLDNSKVELDIGDPALWLHLYSLTFMKIRPEFDPRLNQRIEELAGILFRDRPGWIRSKRWWTVLLKAFGPFSPDDIYLSALQQLKHHICEDHVRKAHEYHTLKDLHAEGITPSHFTNDLQEKKLATTLYNDGQVEIKLIHHEIKETATSYQLMHEESAENRKTVQAGLRRGRRRRIYRMRDPKMRIFYNNVYLGHFSYNENQYVKPPEAADNFTLARQIGTRGLVFFDPMYVEVADKMGWN